MGVTRNAPAIRYRAPVKKPARGLFPVPARIGKTLPALPASAAHAGNNRAYGSYLCHNTRCPRAKDRIARVGGELPPRSRGHRIAARGAILIVRVGYARPLGWWVLPSRPASG